MPARNDKQRSAVVARFEANWRSGERPSVLEFLSDVDASDRDTILKELVTIDIQYRRASGDPTRADDYLQLGTDLVDFASQQLQKTREHSNPDRAIEATACFSQDEESSDSPTKSFARAPASEANDRGQESGAQSGFIGPYELLEMIGEGGMGSVWLAEQREPVRRRVALKVIRGEMDSQAAIARFEAERQAIALMEHQNIAKILDAGTTDSGVPYFAMELVEGVPLNEYCNRNRLGIRQRLELMIPVCRAIHHAHQKGIIHRDLKHSNVLVTQYDGQPVPKVIDFGLAKAFDSENKLTEETIFTEFGHVVGTLQYMSPEQAELNSIDVDTRSDIYSLGVMLYKLLTGTTPLDTRAEDAKTLLQILELIRAKEPEKPSDRLAGFEPRRLEGIAKSQNVKPDKLVQQAKSDVDWIVMKALEKDRERRYESASGLALDIDRFLRNEEVRACPPSTLYRVEKFYKRNKKLVAALFAIGMVLLLGAVGTGTGLIWAIAAQKTATKEARNAMQAKRQAEAAQAIAETQLQAIRIKTAYSDWLLGNVESAWQGIGALDPTDMGWESRYLKTELSSNRDVLYGHALPVHSIHASPDGRFIATASDDNSIKVWDAKTKTILHTVYTEDHPYQVRFTPDSQRVAYVDRSNQISMFDSATGGPVHSLGTFKEDITCLAFLDDGANVVIGTSEVDLKGSDRNIRRFAEVPPLLRILSTDDGAVIAELTGHTKSITAVDCSSDGRFIVSSGDDSTIRIWRKDGDEFTPFKKLDAHYPGVKQVKISPSGKIFASCGKDSTIRLWELETGKSIRTIVGHRGSVNGVSFLSDGLELISASSDQTARIWNLLGEELRAYQGHFEELNKVCLSADDAEFFTTSNDSTVRYYQTLSKTSTLAVRAHRQTVWQADFSADGKRVISASEDGGVAITDTQTGQLIGAKIQLADAVLSVVHSPVADLFVAGSADGQFRVFESTTGRLLKTVAAHDGYIWDIAFSRDGLRMATASSDNSFKVWTTSDWREAKHVKGHAGEIGSVRFSRNSSLIVTASDDKQVKLWDASSYELLHAFEGHLAPVWRAVFSPTDPNVLASSSYDGEIILWDIAGKKQLREPIKAHQDQIAGLAFTADGTRVLSASDDQSIRIWDIQSGIELFVLRDTDDTAIVAASFSRDGSKLVTGNKEGWVTIRSAPISNVAYQPFLPMDAIQIAREVNTALQIECETGDDFRRQLELAEKCCRYFPSYVSFTDQGIAQYRLGQFAKAIVSLREAQRLEPLMYGEPDLPPYIEGYLTLACLKNGQLREARQVHPVFLLKCEAKTWNDDEPVQELQDEIAEALEAAAEPMAP